jgi:hypothetical protein
MQKPTKQEIQEAAALLRLAGAKCHDKPEDIENFEFSVRVAEIKMSFGNETFWGQFDEDTTLSYVLYRTVLGAAFYEDTYKEPLTGY